MEATPSAAPLVYISYSHRDKAWLDKLLTGLRPLEQDNQIRIFSDRAIEAGSPWEESIQAALQEAALGIVLLSPDWLSSEFPTSVELPALKSRPVIPILIRECDWSANSLIAQRQILMADGQPLSAARRPKQDEAFRALARAVRTHLKLTPGLRLSNEASEVYSFATVFARSRETVESVDETCLLFALLERGRSDKRARRTPQFLWGAVPEEGRKQYVTILQELFPSFPKGADLPPVIERSPGVDRVFERASALSSDTLAGGTVHARHLLAALLEVPVVTRRLEDFGVDAAECRKNFLDFVLTNFQDESPDTWERFLFPPPEPQEDLEAQLDTKPGEGGVLAGYQSEDWYGDDFLDVRRDVNALASLAAAWSVEPPLSIGLFGEWGSGKTFFMRRMRQRVRDLALAAQKSGQLQRECAYYRNIVQIEFNAWHYMEGNLWACLVEHIFSNLRLPQDTGEQAEKALEERRRTILEKIGATKALETRAAERKQELQTQVRAAIDRAHRARQERDRKAELLIQERGAFWKNITAELSGETKRIVESIPETTGLRHSADTLEEFARGAMSLAGRVRMQWTLLRHDPLRARILLWFFGALAATSALALIAPLVTPGLGGELTPLLQRFLPVATALAAGVVKAWPVLKRIREVVSLLESKNREISDAIARAEKERERKVTVLQSEVDALAGELMEAEKEQAEHSHEIAVLEEELRTTDASRLLAEFIQSRAQCQDYRKHLGLVALVRRDFERLSELFRLQREAERKGIERLDDNTVNRIILYIDDLDRCPPKKVVEVLQAIHLLLAFPLFVVVVAVDSRWISRSLERCYDWLVLDGAPVSPGQPASDGATQRLGLGSGATAHDYLEKIFQIPFWLAPMDGAACQQLIRGLTDTARKEREAVQQWSSTARSGGRPPAPLPDISEAPPVAGAEGSGEPVAERVDEPPSEALPDSGVPAAEGSKPTQTAADHAETESDGEPVDLAPRHLDIGDPELTRIYELTDLIGRSPRAAKRFLNCYRLLKARMDESELREFLKGRFHEVMEILAIVVGAPSISREVLDTLSAQESGSDGAALVARVEKHSHVKASGYEWVAVSRRLSGATAVYVDALREAIPLVSRFSFRTQPLERAGRPADRRRRSVRKGGAQRQAAQPETTPSPRKGRVSEHRLQ